MLSWLLQLGDVLNRFFQYVATPPGKTSFTDVKIKRPTGEMWMHIQSLERLLVGFEGMTKTLSGDTYPTITLVASEHSGESLYDIVMARMHSVPKAFLILLDKRFGNVPAEIRYCSLLDPRFLNCDHLTTAERADAERFLANQTMRLSSQPATDEDTPNMSFEIDYEAEIDFLGELFKTPRKGTTIPVVIDPSPNVSMHASQEVAMYLRRSQKPTRESPLEWWRRNGDKFGLLAKVARKYLGVLATSVPSERCFSSAGNAVTARRNRSSGSNIRDIVFVHNNLE